MPASAQQLCSAVPLGCLTSCWAWLVVRQALQANPAASASNKQTQQGSALNCLCADCQPVLVSVLTIIQLFCRNTWQSQVQSLAAWQGCGTLLFDNKSVLGHVLHRSFQLFHKSDALFCRCIAHVHCQQQVAEGAAVLARSANQPARQGRVL